MLAEESALDEHLKMLCKILTFLMDESFWARLITLADPNEIYQIFVQEELKKDTEANILKLRESLGKYLIGISAAMTGIAHTYMAAEALLNEAKKRGSCAKI